VLADRRPTDRQPLGQPSDRRRAVAEQFDDVATHRLAEGVEDPFRLLVTHE
jgi:hypothetical protein